MNFIMEMYAKDNPDQFKFERTKEIEKTESHQKIMLGWADRLLGKAKDEFVKRISFPIPKSAIAPNMPRYYPPPKGKD
jgi:hypothetical protein